MAKDPLVIITREQLEAYRSTISPGMILTAPIEAIGENEPASSLKKPVKRECVVLSTHQHFARVKGLKKEGEFSVKYIDLYTNNPVPKEILNLPIFKATKEEEVISEESDEE